MLELEVHVIILLLGGGGATAPSGPGLPYSRSFYITHNDKPQSVGLIWTGDQLVTDTSTHSIQNKQISMPSVEFEPTISAGERP